MRISPLFVLSLLPLTAFAEDDMREMFNELKAQVKTLQTQVQQSSTRINELEKELAQAHSNQQPAQTTPPVAPTAKADETVNKPAVTVGDVKGTFKIPGTDTSIGLGGYVKTEVLFNSVSAGRDKFGDQFTVYSQIPVGDKNAGEHSQITFNAKESRLWFRSFTPSKWGDINTYLETDFYGDAATYTYTPRLRHAYASMGNFLAGQTWTTFLNVNVLPNTLDAGGSAGAVYGVRQPLVRWTQPFTIENLPMDVQIALEAPRSRIRDNANADSDVFSSPNSERYPDLVARVNVNPDWGKFSLAALGRQIRNTNVLNSQSEWGGAVSLAGKINSVDLDSIRFMLNYGNAMGRYVASANTFEDAVLSNGDLQLVDIYSGMLSYQHFWTKDWQSNLTYGFIHANQPALAGNNITSEVQSIHANLLWSPITQIILGMEYIYATREVFDGRDGDLQRVQFSARYNF